MKRKGLLRDKIEATKGELSIAAADLDKVLGEIKVAPRAEKTAMSDVVRDAFDKLKAAKAHLEDLERLLEEEEP